MITRAQIEEQLALYHTRAEQVDGLRNWLESNLPASPVVNGPLAEYLNSEGVTLRDFILGELHTYQNWIRDE